MDRRLADRRRRVAEDRARTNLGRLVRFLTFVAALAGVVWLAQSPLLSVAGIDVTGSDRVDAEAVLAQNGIVAGRPMILLDISAATAALGADPWVATARVARDWPTRVVVEMVERVPAVGLHLADGWWLAAPDGTVLESVAPRAEGYPVASFPRVSKEEASDDFGVKGAVEYLAALALPLQASASVTRGSDGLEATVGGFVVRLGRPFEMAAKASVTGALLATPLEDGSIVTVVAPASPAVLPPDTETDIDP